LPAFTVFLNLKTLHVMGVARVSLGPAFLKMPIRTMKEIAEKLKNYEGIEEITGNGITTDYLKNLPGKKPNEAFDHRHLNVSG